MFDELVIGYLFLGGTGAGTLVLLCLFNLASCARRQSLLNRILPPYDVVVRAWPACFVLLALGAFCLMADLGRLDRLFDLLWHPRFSVMTVGAYSLLASILCAGVFSLASLLDTVSLPKAMTTALSLCGLAAGFVCMAYTGVLLQDMPSVLFWNTPFLPVLFSVSSISCGISTVMGCAAFAETRLPVSAPLIELARIDGLLIVSEALVLTGMLVAVMSEAQASVHALVAGDLRWPFWGGVLVAGLALPYGLERFVRYGNYRSHALWIAGLILVGGVMLRFCIVQAGIFDITQAGSAADWLG